MNKKKSQLQSTCIWIIASQVQHFNDIGLELILLFAFFIF